MIYHLICFADLILDEPTRDVVGISMIAVCSFNLVSNLSHIMFGEIKKIYKVLRLKYFKWKLEKLKKRIKEKEEKEKVKKLEEEEIKKFLESFLHKNELAFMKEPVLLEQDS